MDKLCQLVDDTGVFVESEWIKVGKKYGGPYAGPSANLIGPPDFAVQCRALACIAWHAT